MFLLVTTSIFQHNRLSPALVPFCILPGCSKMSSKMMSWAAQHNGIFEAKTCTLLQRAALAKGQHFLLKIRERRHFFWERSSCWFPCRDEAGAFSSTCKGTLEELCYNSSVYCPWRHEDSIMPAKMLNFLLLGLHPFLVKLSRTSEKKLITGLRVPQLSHGRVFLTSTAPSWIWDLAAEAICAVQTDKTKK